MAVTWAGAVWAPSTTYPIGSRVVAGAGVYFAAQGGESMPGGVGPTGTGIGIPDGTVRWNYVGPASVWTVVGVAPELATTAAATQAVALASTDNLDPCVFGAQLDEAAAYLAAHVATLSRLRGHGGIASEGEGPFSRSYAMPRKPDSDLGLTSYGARYEAIVRTTVAVFGFTAGQC